MMVWMPPHDAHSDGILGKKKIGFEILYRKTCVLKNEEAATYFKFFLKGKIK